MAAPVEAGAAVRISVPRACPMLLSRPVLMSAMLALAFAGLATVYGPVAAGQATLNGFIAGGYIGLGAIGLTLVLGVLKLVNFAHGDLLMAGAYFTILFRWLGLPLPLAMLIAMAATAFLALLT